MLARAWREDRWLLAAVAAALGIRIVFWIVTDRVWEDALISISPARNALSGIGLTHHPGEGRVYSFTSALSVLVPLAGELLHRGSAIVALRVASLAGAVVTMFFAYRLGLELRLSRVAMAFVLGYLAFDPLQVFYGMAGMETQLAVAILLGGALALVRYGRVGLGLALGLAILARPEFVIWVIVVLIYVGLRRLRDLPRVVGLAALVAGPWIVFTTLYYGSPIPETIRAKAGALIYPPPPDLTLSNWAAVLGWLPTRGPNLVAMWRVFAPFYNVTAVVRAPLASEVLLGLSLVFIGLAGLGAWSVRRQRAWWPVLAYIVFFVAYRAVLLPAFYFDWYLPPFLALVALLAGVGIDRVRAHRPQLTSPAAALLAVAYMVPVLFTIPVDATVQHEVENRVHRPVGEHLAQVMKPGEAVISEGAGYVGYYSGAIVYDFPGLTSPTSLRALARHAAGQRSLYTLIDDLQPQWLVLRPTELEELARQYPAARARYTVEATFSSKPLLRHWRLEEGNIDTEFFVMHRGD